VRCVNCDTFDLKQAFKIQLDESCFVGFVGVGGLGPAAREEVGVNAPLKCKSLKHKI
jgi:hypothetical protein